MNNIAATLANAETVIVEELLDVPHGSYFVLRRVAGALVEHLEGSNGSIVTFGTPDAARTYATARGWGVVSTPTTPTPNEVVDQIVERDITDNGEAAEIVERLRRRILCSEFVDTLSPDAEQFFLLAMASLDQAKHFFELARMRAARAVRRQLSQRLARAGGF